MENRTISSGAETGYWFYAKRKFEAPMYPAAESQFAPIAREYSTVAHDAAARIETANTDIAPAAILRNRNGKIGGSSLFRLTIFASACFVGTVAHAHPQSMDAAQIARNPKPFVGREIRLTSAKCAREPEGKYACAIGRGENKLRIESLGIDFQTSEPVRRTIVLRCSGRLEKVDSACIFDIELKISSIRVPSEGAGSTSNVVLIARKMNLFTSKPQ